MAEVSVPMIATLTVMRNEVALLESLVPDLAFAAERHVVVTSTELHDLSHVSDVHVHHHPLVLGAPFDAARATALPYIQSRWILIVDTDEKIPPPLVEVLFSRIGEFESSGIDGVWIPRQNFVLDVPLHFSSAWPDFQLRFVRRDSVSFSNQLHNGIGGTLKHERLDADPKIAIQHFNFVSTASFVDKINLYTSIESEQSVASSQATVWRAFKAGAREFLARYVKMRGFKDGSHGLHFALMMSIYRYLSIAKTWERESR